MAHDCVQVSLACYSALMGLSKDCKAHWILVSLGQDSVS